MHDLQEAYLQSTYRWILKRNDSNLESVAVQTLGHLWVVYPKSMHHIRFLHCRPCTVPRANSLLVSGARGDLRAQPCPCCVEGCQLAVLLEQLQLEPACAACHTCSTGSHSRKHSGFQPMVHPSCPGLATTPMFKADTPHANTLDAHTWSHETKHTDMVASTRIHA